MEGCLTLLFELIPSIAEAVDRGNHKRKRNAA